MKPITEFQRILLAERASDLQEALSEFAYALQQAGGRDSDSQPIRSFSAYHLADLEGKEAGWLGSGFLKDALRELVDGLAEDGEEEEEKS